MAADGRAYIYDYKTGLPPSPSEQRYFDKQLLLEAAMAENGDFEGLGPALVAAALRGIPEWQRELGSFMATVVRLWIAMPGDL